MKRSVLQVLVTSTEEVCIWGYISASIWGLILDADALGSTSKNRALDNDNGPLFIAR